MSSTNKTLTIELSQYVGTDKPTYLSDYNGDMLKIDNAIAADRDSIATAQSKADGADAKADTNAGAISTLDNQINNASNGVAKRVTDVEGDVNTIESLIGNGTPTTSDKTLIGAINELDTIKLDISDLTASAVPVSPISGMSAANVQAALEEVNVNVTKHSITSATRVTLDATDYVLPTDGYVMVYTTTTAGYADLKADNVSLILVDEASASHREVFTMFVKAGMTINFTTTNNSDAYFYPLG